MHSILSNQQLINEINSIKDNYIQSRPKMVMNVFKGTRQLDGRTNKYDRAEQPKFLGGGSPAFKSHPLGYQPPGGSTVGVDPLFSGVVDRPVPKGEKTPRGGAMLKQHMPLNCEDSESDEEGGGYGDPDSSDYDSDDCGAGIVDDVKEKYHKTKEYVKGKIPSKAQMTKVSNAVYKMITSNEAKEMGVGALKVAVAALIVAQLGPYGAPVSAAANAAIDTMSKGRRNYNPSAEEMRSALKARPINRQLTTTRDDDDDTTPLMPRGGKIKKIVGKKRGESARGAIVSEVMKKKGLSLGAASKYVKEHNLY